MPYFSYKEYQRKWAVFRRGYSFPYMYPYPKYMRLTEEKAESEAKRLNNERKDNRQN